MGARQRRGAMLKANEGKSSDGRGQIVDLIRSEMAKADLMQALVEAREGIAPERPDPLDAHP